MCSLNPVTPFRTEGAAFLRTFTNGWKVGAGGSLRFDETVAEAVSGAGA